MDASAVLSIASPSRKNADVEDQDLLLARALQEQEHAYAMLYGGLGAYDDGGSDCEGDEGEGGEPAGPVGSNSSERTAQVDSAGAAGAAPRDGEEEGDDEALARRLHEEERRDLFSRMLAMSGYHQVASAEEGEPEAVDAMSYEDLQVLGDVVGVVSRGLSADAIVALPSVTVAQLQQAASGGVGGPLADAAGRGPGSSGSGSEGCPPAVEVPQRCSICLVDLDAEDVLKLLPCRHAYHAECLGTWLDVSKACPDCRREVEVAAQHPAPPGSS